MWGINNVPGSLQVVTWSCYMLQCSHFAVLANTPYKCPIAHRGGLVQDCSISSALALEILQSCTKPLICDWRYGCVFAECQNHWRRPILNPFIYLLKVRRLKLIFWCSVSMWWFILSIAQLQDLMRSYSKEPYQILQPPLYFTWVDMMLGDALV